MDAWECSHLTVDPMAAPARALALLASFPPSCTWFPLGAGKPEPPLQGHAHPGPPGKRGRDSLHLEVPWGYAGRARATLLCL